MTTRALGLLLALALAGALLALLWSTQGAGPVPAPEELPPAAGAERPAVAPRPPAELVDGGDPGERERETGAAGAAGPHEADEADLPARGLAVRVVERASGAPVAGARVRWARAREPRAAADVEEELDLGSASVETDARGEARLALDAGAALVDARRGELWGFRRVDGGEGSTLVLSLVPDRTLAVRAVDGAGRPVAGVPVAIRLDALRAEGGDLWRGATGEDGVARVRHFDALLGERAREAALAAVLAFPTRSPVAAALEGVAGFAAPIELVVPDSGSLAVSVLDPSRRPVDQASLRVAVERGDGALAQAGPASFERPIPVARGEVVLPFVEVGLELHLQAEAPAWRPARARGFGPRAPGEGARIEIVFGEAWPVLVGRLVDERGAALPSRGLRARLAARADAAGGPASPSWQAWSTTDAQGRFRIELEHDPAASSDELTLTVVGRGGAGERSARVPVALPAAGERDLGDVVARESPLVAAGRVVDERARPVPGARVRVRRPILAGAGGEGARSRVEPELGARADAEGRFELRGDTDAPELLVQAWHEGHLPGPEVSIAPGARALELVLERTGTVEGSLALDGEVPSQSITIDVGGRRTSLRRDASFVAQLRPGSYRVTVALAGDPDPLAVVEDVVVLAGETTRDVRLSPIDLRGRFALARIELVDDQGAAVASPGRVRARPHGAAAPVRAFEIEGGRAHVPLRGLALDLEVQVQGYRTARLESVDGDRRVALRRGLPLVLQLGPSFAPPAAPARLVATLAWQGTADRDAGGRASASGATAPFDANGEARFELAEPGRYTVQLFLSGGTKHASTRSVAVVPGDLVVEDQDFLQHRTVTPHAGDWSAALEAVR